MLPTPADIVRMVTAISDAVTETMRFGQTPQGAALWAQLQADRTRWDKFWADPLTPLKQFFSGKWQIGQ